MDDQQYIIKHLQEQQEFFLNQNKALTNANIIGIFLVGHQNYGLNQVNAPINSIIITLPLFTQFCLNTQKRKQEWTYQNNDHIYVIDIQSYREDLLQQDIKSLETLYSLYYIINPLYKSIFQQYFLNYRETLVHLDEEKLYYSILTQFYQIYNKNYIDNADAAELERIYLCLYNYCENKPFDECLVPSEEQRKNILKIQEGNIDVLAKEQRIDKIMSSIRKIHRFHRDFQKTECKNIDNGVIELIQLGFSQQEYLVERPSLAQAELFYQNLPNSQKEVLKLLLEELSGREKQVISIKDFQAKNHISIKVYQALLFKMEKYRIAETEYRSNGTIFHILQPDIYRIVKEDE